MGGCYGRRDGVFAEKPDVGIGGASREEEGDRVQMSVQEKGSSIRKRGRKVQGLPSSEWLFTEKKELIMRKYFLQ
jgi:hypothetical protein